jgi:hypothetical protein
MSCCWLSALLTVATDTPQRAAMSFKATTQHHHPFRKALLNRFRSLIYAILGKKARRNWEKRQGKALFVCLAQFPLLFFVSIAKQKNCRKKQTRKIRS